MKNLLKERKLSNFNGTTLKKFLRDNKHAIIVKFYINDENGKVCYMSNGKPMINTDNYNRIETINIPLCIWGTPLTELHTVKDSVLIVKDIYELADASLEFENLSTTRGKQMEIFKKLTAKYRELYEEYQMKLENLINA